MQAQLQAARAVLQVLAGSSLSIVLPKARVRAGSAQQAGAVQDMSFGVLRHLGLLRELLTRLAHRPLVDPDVEALLLVGLYQLEFTRAPQHTVVDQVVRACVALRKTSARVLANAVLRNYLRGRERLLEEVRTSEVGRWSHPQWWIDMLRAAYPDRFVAILESGNLRPPMTLRVNRRKTDVETYQTALEGNGIASDRIGFSALLLANPLPIDRLPGFVQGLASVQDLSAQYAAPLLDLQPGQRVLDACAAPGGKTAHIAELEEVELTAIDVDAGRLQLVAHAFDRLQLTAPRMIHADAAALDTWWDGIPFQRILLDAPCTGSGIVRRHPDIKWLRRASDVRALAAQQQLLLSTLWRTLAPDGKLLYATCSVFPEETRLQLFAFLQSHLDARRLELSAIPEIGNIEGQIFPDSRHDGFFYALLQKV
jgi:16S rRNA (cytosine967-C5)-methyltransferase